MRIVVISCALALAALPAAANADVYCPTQISIFGTVDGVHGNLMTVDTTSDVGHIHVRLNRPAMDAHGLTLRPGVFVGVYGCLQKGGGTFDADNVTIASSAAAYADYQRPYRDFSGRITAVSGGRIELQTSDGTLWVTTSQRGFARGQSVNVHGWFEPRNGGFVASRVSVAH